jgi:tellurium resistance protein TerZ
MAITLVKGQKISLQKEGGGGLTKVVMGLGWDPVKKKSGFFSMAKAPDIDLDASCALFDENKNVVDVVSFQQLRSKDGSINHSGDNLTGAGEGDDERINVNLQNVPANVKYMAFVVTSYRGQTFNDVENAYCRLVDETSNQEIARYTLSGGGNNTAMIMAKLYRHQGEWKMHALGDPANGRVVRDLLPNVKSLL